MKKNIYLASPNYVFGKDVYLPYPVGVLAAFAFREEDIKEFYQLGKFLYVKEDIETSIDSLESPFLFGFSCYVWNMEYNKKYAKKLKETYPNCYILFGGHSVSTRDAQLLEEESYIDFLIHDEGEFPFLNLLRALRDGTDLEQVENISYRKKTGEISKTKTCFYEETEYPSPYLEGYFEQLMAEDQHYSFSATLETNRGCPFQCTFCDWGVYKSKFRVFPMERIEREIQWFSDHQIDFLFGADSNFGILPRDKEIAELLVKQKAKTGFPNKFRTCYTKNSDETVFELCKLLSDGDLCKGVTLSFQSMDQTTLENIKRINMKLPVFQDMVKRYRSLGVPTYTDIIIGLPGETFESFCTGIDLLLQNGQHSSLLVYHCELLVNSKMAEEAYREEHGIATLNTQANAFHCTFDPTDLQERANIVIETKTMPQEDWKRTNIFSCMVQTFHCQGILRNFAIYFFYEKGVSYQSFYNEFIMFVQENEKLKWIYDELLTRLDEALYQQGSWGFVDEKYGNILWPFEEYSFLNVVYRLDEFYHEVYGFLRRYESEDSLLEELLRYQKLILEHPDKERMSEAFTQDWNEYYTSILTKEYTPLVQVENEITLVNPLVFSDFEEYAREIVWYGRKAGRAIHQNVEVTYRK